MTSTTNTPSTTVLLTHPHTTPAEARGPAAGTATLSHRDRAILRAVARGGAELSISVEPDLFLDGRCCSDQPAARRLAHAGLIVAAIMPPAPASAGGRVQAHLSAAGHHHLQPGNVETASTWRNR